MNNPFRLAASSYLNSAPLIWSFLNGPHRGSVDFIEAVPARCAQLLAESLVEGALIPVIEYQRIAGGLLARNVCVGSRKEVLSVVLVSKNKRLEEIRSVALDESSRTSATLVKIVFGEFLRREPEWTTRAPDLDQMLEKNDAALIIGDPGMTFRRHGLNVWDMASLWREHTGLGFVFAMWMVRDHAIDRACEVDFGGARDEGVSHIEEIVRSYQDKIPMSVAELRNYLTENIVFTVDESMERGLRLYFELAFKHKLIEHVKELRFI
ncbi:MAG TPA: menaquinone biosynthesis protein [Pyrinomonadaceae bacterium]|nr:menaquinone biosynthesis protein [Pyrinomonadaceae bacterium]